MFNNKKLQKQIDAIVSALGLRPTYSSDGSGFSRSSFYEGALNDIQLYRGSLQKLEEEVRILTSKLKHMENQPKADALIAEFEKLGGLGKATYGNNKIVVRNQAVGSTYPYSFGDFECDVLCQLRKQELEKLQKAKELSDDLIGWDSKSIADTYLYATRVGKKRGKRK